MAGRDPVTWSDVADHAQGLGTWAALERQVVAETAALDRARGAGADPSPAQMREAEAAFRYERRLVAGDDMRAWLAARDLTVGEWRNWVRADLCRRSLPEEAAQDVIPGDLSGAHWVTGWCSGQFPPMAREFAGRVAVARRLAEQGLDLPLDEAFERFRADAVTEDALREAVASNHLEWITVECDWSAFPDEDAAREALACLRDGLSIDELAAMGATVTRKRIVVGEVPGADRQRFLSAQEGDVLGPVAVGDGFAVAAVRWKDLPTLQDDVIRDRAEAFVLGRAVTREIDERVTWVELL